MAVCGCCWICGCKLVCGGSKSCGDCSGNDPLVVMRASGDRFKPEKSYPVIICGDCELAVEAGAIGAVIDAIRAVCK